MPALAGAWLLAFPDPLDIGVDRLAVALLALGAAVLLASGTVLGRFVAPRLTAVELTTLAVRDRAVVGAALIVAAVTALPLHESRARVPSVQQAPDAFEVETADRS